VPPGIRHRRGRLGWPLGMASAPPTLLGGRAAFAHAMGPVAGLIAGGFRLAGRPWLVSPARLKPAYPKLACCPRNWGWAFWGNVTRAPKWPARTWAGPGGPRRGPRHSLGLSAGKAGELPCRGAPSKPVALNKAPEGNLLTVSRALLCREPFIPAFEALLGLPPQKPCPP